MLQTMVTADHFLLRSSRLCSRSARGESLYTVSTVYTVDPSILHTFPRYTIRYTVYTVSSGQLQLECRNSKIDTVMNT